MVTLTKALSFFALLCPLGLASDCGAACVAEDQTSLLQVKDVVTHGSERAGPSEAEEEASSEEQEDKEEAEEGEDNKADSKEDIPFVVNGQFVGPAMAAGVGATLGVDAAMGRAENAAVLGRMGMERAEMARMAGQARFEAEPMHPNMWPTPVVNMKAIADSTPAGIDIGEVNAAFGHNMERAKGTVIGRAARKLMFQDRVRNERNAIKLATARSIRADKIATMEALHRDKVGVAVTAANRAAVIGEAIEKVNAAKEEALAHGIKQQQAQQAALMGRLIGAKEGAEDALRADAEMKHKWAVEQEAAVYAEEKKAAARAKAMERAAVNKDTKVRSAELGVYAARNKKESEAVKASAAADSSLWEDDLEGPESIKEEMLKHEANRVAKGYARMAGKNQEVIEDLSMGADRKAVEDDVDEAEGKLAGLETAWP